VTARVISQLYGLLNKFSSIKLCEMNQMSPDACKENILINIKVANVTQKCTEIYSTTIW